MLWNRWPDTHRNQWPNGVEYAAWKRMGETGLTMAIGLMFHGWEWGSAKDGTDTPMFFHAMVQNGVLEYPHPDDNAKLIRQEFERRDAQ